MSRNTVIYELEKMATVINVIATFVTPALQKHFKETSFTTCTEQVPSKNRQPLLCMRSVSILAVRARLCMNPSYTTPFWMHVRGGQLSSVPSLQAFSDLATLPLFQKLEV